MEECGATLLIMDSLSNEWESNSRIYSAVRDCSLCADPKNIARSPKRRRQERPHRSNLVRLDHLGDSGTECRWIIAAMQSAGHADNCRLAPMRCNLPADFRFQPEADAAPN